MKRLIQQVALLVLVGQALSAYGSAATDGIAHLNFRYRIESVDQQGAAENALASTLRTRVNYLSAPFANTQVFLEADNVTYLGNDAFNNTRNGTSRYPVVADPRGTGMNQFYVQNRIQDFTTTLGRQRILQDGQRFIGGVGWRQNEQTYDGLGVRYQPATQMDASWHYIKRVSRIFGPEGGTPDASLDSDSHLARLHYTTKKLGALTAYGYFLDFEDAVGLSSRTTGIRYQRSFQISNISLPLSLEYAHQNDYGDNPANLSLNFFAIDLQVKTGYATFSFGNERLEGSSAGGFMTPLATLHKFQGWTDTFLNTPANGIDDRYIGMSGKAKGYKWEAVYHDFDAERGSNDYGHELDLSVSYQINDTFSGLLKWAHYSADTFGSDTSKAWLMLTAAL